VTDTYLVTEAERTEPAKIMIPSKRLKVSGVKKKAASKVTIPPKVESHTNEFFMA